MIVVYELEYKIIGKIIVPTSCKIKIDYTNQSSMKKDSYNTLLHVALF